MAKLPWPVTLLLIFSCNPKPQEKPLFTKGVYPVVFDEPDFPLHPKTRAPMKTSGDCAPCHKPVYENWLKSRHRVALTNELYEESHAREPSPWCVNCHAPLRLSGSEKTPYRGDEGISCLVCHVRAGEILTGAPPAVSGQPAHRYRVDPQFKDERVCENCHDFNFPTAASAMSEGKDFHYTDQPMQSTVTEYRASAYYGKVTCQGCHLFRDTADTHSFPGGHALGRLSRDLKVEVVRENSDSLTLRIYAQGIGHAFPTGDLFRTLRLRVSDERNRYVREIELRHFFETVPAAERSQTTPLKLRVREETLPPPQLDYVSMREYALPWPGTSRQVTTELYIDYLAQVNTLTSTLPARVTRPLIRRDYHRLPRKT